jgi:hypothetical protein
LRNCRENVNKVFHEEEQLPLIAIEKDAIQNYKRSDLLAACICCGII